MSKTRILPEGTLVELVDPEGNFRAGRLHLKTPLTITQPEHFERYREDARLLLKVVKGECSQEEALTIPEFGLNAIGVDNLLAALIYEVVEEGGHL